jgi:hypothetical protein
MFRDLLLFVSLAMLFGVSLLPEEDTLLRVLLWTWSLLIGLVGAAALTFKSNKASFIPSEGENPEYVFIQGSGSYLFIDLDLAGKVVHVRELLISIRDYIDDSLEKFKFEPHQDHSKRLKTLAGCLMCRRLLETRLSGVKYFFSSRKIPAQLWCGYAVDRDIDTNAVDILELGSGQLKYYRHGSTEMEGFDAKELLTIHESSGAAASQEWIGKKFSGATCFATGDWRTLSPIENVEILSQDEEMRLENLAAKTALEESGPEGFAFCGNMAWGNGSTQGLVLESQTLVEIGLKAILKELGNPGSLDDLKLGIQRAILFLDGHFIPE